METEHCIRRKLLRISLIAAFAFAASAAVSNAHLSPPGGSTVQKVEIHYRANGGRRRIAYLLLPGWYGPKSHPALPLVIAPHGSGPGPFLELARLWGNLAARGSFAVVLPEGQGRELAHYSWGYPGQIDDLGRMPEIVRRALPWVSIDDTRVYAVGGSMGGQESLLLVARYPHLLAGAVAFDSPADIALRYEQFSRLGDGELLRTLMRTETGGTPDEDPDAYAERSPLHFARAIAASGVPLQIWWSTRDELVVDQQFHSGRLYSEIKRLNPSAPVTRVVGTWPHTAEMRWNRRLPDALRFLRLLPGPPAGT
jgi:pimeloyl-ACP methyl ester carboxylesterase